MTAVVVLLFHFFPVISARIARSPSSLQQLGRDRRRSLLECTTYNAQTARLVVDSAGCVIISNSFFYNLESADAGAVWLKSSVTSSSTSLTSFVSCRAVCDLNKAVYGGGMRLDCPVNEISLCCSKSCRAEDGVLTTDDYVDRNGGFVHVEAGSSHSFAQTTIVDAYARRRGSINFQGVCTFALVGLNFTGCTAYSTGSAFTVMNASSQFTASFLTVVGSGGVTCIDSYCATSPDVSYCNFYGNALTGSQDYGVLYAHSWGLRVDGCIFNGNSPRDIIMKAEKQTGNIEQKFLLTNCAFSGGFPSAAYASSDSSCNANVETASHFIGHMNTYHCPGVTPTSSVSRTRSPSESPRFPDSADLTDSLGFEATADFSGASGQVNSELLAASVTLLPSRKEEFGSTPLLGASITLELSEQLREISPRSASFTSFCGFAVARGRLARTTLFVFLVRE